MSILFGSTNPPAHPYTYGIVSHTSTHTRLVVIILIYYCFMGLLFFVQPNLFVETSNTMVIKDLLRHFFKL